MGCHNSVAVGLSPALLRQRRDLHEIGSFHSFMMRHELRNGNDHPRSLGQRKNMGYISGIGGCTVQSIRRIIVQVII